MVVNKRRKSSRMRAMRSYHGSHKKHRGHGSKGGSGLGGTGKRADSKKPSFWHEVYFGKFGFNRNVTLKEINTINIRDIEMQLDEYISQKLITKENDVYIVELEKLGFQKLLGDGKATHKFRLTAKFASGIAIEKIKEAGGEITLTIVKKEKKKEDKAEKPKKAKAENAEEPEDSGE